MIKYFLKFTYLALVYQCLIKIYSKVRRRMINFIWNFICNIFNKQKITKQEITEIKSDISNVEELIDIYEKKNVELFSMSRDYIEMKENLQKLLDEMNSKKNK